MGALALAAVPAIIGATVTGISAVRANRQAQRQEDSARQQAFLAEQQNNAANMQAFQQMQAQAASTALAQRNLELQSEQRRQNASQDLRKNPAVKALGQYGVKTSPLGDTSTANTGRAKLLGN